MKSFSIVVAMDDRRGIGKSGTLAWRLSGDLKYFKELTSSTLDTNKKNAVIMGRKTWDSLPEKFRPLPGRINVVLSQNPKLQLPSGVLLFSNIDEAVKSLSFNNDVDEIFVIGGGQIYAQSLMHPACKTLFITHVKGDYNCDTIFPSIPIIFKLIEESEPLNESSIQYRFAEYQK